MKSEIVLMKGNRSARITLRYDNPFTTTKPSYEGDPNILGIFDFHVTENHGYFVGEESPENAEWYLNLLPVLRLQHGITAQIDRMPPFDEYAPKLDPDLVY